jgi:predicted Zn-dependent peptidase
MTPFPFALPAALRRAVLAAASLLLATGTATVAAAQSAGTAAAAGPQGGGAAVASIESRTLPNGLRLLVLPDPAQARLSAGLVVGAGWVHNPRGKEGLADLAAALDHLRVRQAIEDGRAGKSYLAGEWSATVSSDHALFAATALAEDLDPLCATIRAAIPAPAEPFLAAPALKREALLKLLQTRTAGGLVAREALAPALYGDRRPLGHSARFQTLLGVFPADVREFHRAYYVPANAVLFMAGPITADQAAAAAARHFGDWAASEPGAPTWGHAPDEAAHRGVTLVDDPDAATAILLGGFAGPGREDPAFAEMQLLHQVIGSGQLEAAIASLAATHPAGYQFRTQLRASARGSEITIEVAIAPDLAARALAEVERGLGEIAAGIDAAAFTRAVEARTASLALRFETPEARLREAAAMALAGRPLDAIAEPAGALAALDRTAVAAGWRSLLAPERRAWVAVGRADLLAPQFQTSGIATTPTDVFAVVTGRLFEKTPDAPLTLPSAASTAQAEELLFAAMEARGGFENLERVESYAAVETLYVQAGAQFVAGERKLFVKEPDRFREVLRVGPLQGEGLVQVLARDRIWRQQLGKPADTPPWREEDLRGRFWLDPFRAFHRYAEPGAMISLIDPDFVAGTTLDGFQITAPSGYYARYHLHPQSRQVVKRTTSRPTEADILKCEELFTDYRAVEGVFLPFIYATYTNGEYASESHLKSIEINAEIPDDLYAPPR